MTTAFEIVVVVLVGYAIGYKLASTAGGVVGLSVGAAASFVRLYYRVPEYESPLSRLKEQARAARTEPESKVPEGAGRSA